MKSMLFRPSVFAALTLVATFVGLPGQADAAPQLAQNGSWVMVPEYCVQVRANPTQWRTVACFPTLELARRQCRIIRGKYPNVVCRVVRRLARKRLVNNNSLIDRPNVDQLNQGLPGFPGGLRRPPGAQPDPSPWGRFGR